MNTSLFRIIALIAIVRGHEKRLCSAMLIAAVLVGGHTRFCSSSQPPARPVVERTSQRSRLAISEHDRFVWSSYMICFSLSRDYTGLFYDRPLDRAPASGRGSRLADLLGAVEAGVDALAIDLFIWDKNAHPCFRQLVDLIHEHDLPIGLSPMFDGFNRPGLTEEHVFQKVKEWFELFGDEDCVVRTDGKPVILTFGPAALKPEQWQRLFTRLRNAGCRGHWIFEGGGPLFLGREPAFDRVAPWLRIFDGAYTFSPGESPARPVLNARLYREQYSAEGKLWTGSVKTGYWRPEIAVYTSPEGTARYRRSWDAVREAGIHWVQQATWNDFSENHGIMPSANLSTTFTELTRHLIRNWRGLPTKPTNPRLFLARMREVQVGEDAFFELLALLPEDSSESTFELALFDGSGGEVHRFASRSRAVDNLAVVYFQYPVSDIPAGRLLSPRATVRTPDGQSQVVDGQATVVSPAGFHPERCYSWLYEPAHRQLRGVDLCFELDGVQPGDTLRSTSAKGRVSINVRSLAPLADLEVLHCGKPVYVLRRRPQGLFPATQIVREFDLQRDRAGHLAWGFYQVRATTVDRRVIVSRPVFVDAASGSDDLVGYWPFDHGTDYRVLDASPWIRDGRLGARTHYSQHQPQRVSDGRDGQCVRFDGLDDRIQMDGPVVPDDRYTVECWMKPETWGWPTGDKGAVVMASANAGLVVILRRDGTLHSSRKGNAGWVRIEGTAPVPLHTWTHIAVTFDGTTMTLFQNGKKIGSARVPGRVGISRFAVGYNSVTLDSFYHGCIDDIRIHERVLVPMEFGPRPPIGCAAEPDQPKP